MKKAAVERLPFDGEHAERVTAGINVLPHGIIFVQNELEEGRGRSR